MLKFCKFFLCENKVFSCMISVSTKVLEVRSEDLVPSSEVSFEILRGGKRVSCCQRAQTSDLGAQGDKAIKGARCEVKLGCTHFKETELFFHLLNRRFNLFPCIPYGQKDTLGFVEAQDHFIEQHLWTNGTCVGRAIEERAIFERTRFVAS